MAPPLLPTSASSSKQGRAGSLYSFEDSYSRGGNGNGVEAYTLPKGERGLPLVLRRLGKFKSMDFELAFWQLTYLIVSPRRVYKQTYHHKQTKNVWARDDPAMLILISGFSALSGLIWSFIYHKSVFSTITQMFLMIFRDFVISSLAIALILHTLSNKLLIPTSPNSQLSDSRVEYAYSFDVAVNSFFPAFLTIHLGLILMAGVLVRDNWVCLFVGNTLFLIAAIQYIYITYLGYNALPFIARSEILLAPLLPIFVGYLLSLLGFNVSKHALAIYFGQPWHL